MPLKHNNMSRFQYAFIGAVLMCCVLDAAVVRYQTQFYNGFMREEEDFIECICANDTKRTVPLTRPLSKAIVTGSEMSSAFCGKGSNSDACNLLNTCKNCKLSLLTCTLPEEKKKGFCLNVTYHMADESTKNTKYLEYQKIHRNSSSLLPENHSMVKRNIKACGHPTSMKTADVACYTTPAVVKCTQTCVFGHTLKDGVVKKLTCHTRENKWKPSGFSECQPFVDCTLRLVSPGSLDCYTATATQAPICYVRCDRFEDKPQIRRRAYECQMDGSWSRSLPYCAKPGSGIALVPRPHKITSYI